MKQIKKLWDESPLKLIIGIALFFRIIAAFFSKGFGMHDDHFLIIEASKSWVDGYDYNHWLPWSPGNVGPEGHSFFYVGIHYLLFSFFKLIGVQNPQFQMLIIRILHAFYSLLIVSISFNITKKISNLKNARIVGIFLATYFILPFLSVRNLVEVVCVPLLLAGISKTINFENKEKNMLPLIWAGFLFGLAFSVRFQTIMFTGGVGLALLFRKKWKETFFVAIGTLVSIVLIQGGIDIFIWGTPFTELGEYIRYNLTHAQDYNVVPWYTYLLLIAGILIPPISIFFIFGFFQNWKKNLIIFLPTLLFFLFHSYFPNKQERFILPVLPFIIILGIIGWNRFKDNSRFWKNHIKLHRACWIFFWIINLALLPVISVMYSKKARVETMTYLSAYPNIPSMIIENTNEYSTKQAPRFYLNQWIPIYEISKSAGSNTVENEIEKSKKEPAFVIFEGPDNLQARVDSIKNILPNIVPDTVIKPGFVDEFLHYINPINANQTSIIYRNKDIFPKKVSNYEKN
ncbi:MAG: glycosyltransferase family 39 protein [Bacteroidales bacterium]